MKRICTIIVLFGMLAATGAWGTTYYVSPSGSNTSPYDTWAKASTAVSTLWTIDLVPGDIIEVDGGTSGVTYSTGTTAVISVGANDGGITIRGSSEAGHDGTVTIDGDTNTLHGVYTSASVDGTTTIENMTIYSDPTKSCVYAAKSITVNNCFIDGTHNTSTGKPVRSEGAGVVSTYNNCTFDAATFFSSINVMSDGAIVADNCAFLATGGVSNITTSGSGTITITDSTIDGSGSTAGAPISTPYTGGIINLKRCVITGCGYTSTLTAYSGGEINIEYSIVKGYVNPSHANHISCGGTTAGSIGTINSDNNLYIDPGTRFVVCNRGTVTSKNDIFLAPHGDSVATSLFYTGYADGTIDVADGFLTQGPRTYMGNAYISTGAGTENIDITVGEYPKFVAAKHSPVRITVTVDDSTTPYCTDIGAVADTYNIPMSYAMVAISIASFWGPTEQNIYDNITACMGDLHEVINHSWMHSDLSKTNGLLATATGCVDPKIEITGTYPSLTLKVYENYGGGTPDLTLDLTSASYNTLAEVSAAIDALAAWVCAVETDVATTLASNTMKVQATTCPNTVQTGVPFELSQLYTYEITQATNWWESRFGPGFVTAFAYPYGGLCPEVQDWLVSEVATHKMLGARAFSPAEVTSPFVTQNSDRLHIMGLTNVKTGYIMSDGPDVTAQETIEKNTRSWITWLMEGDHLGVLTIHQTEASAADLAIMFAEIQRAVNAGYVTVMKFSDYVEWIRDTYTSEGSGIYSTTVTDSSNYRLTDLSPMLNGGSYITGMHDQVAAAVDLDNVSILRRPDCGPYQYTDQNLYFDYSTSNTILNGTKSYPFDALTDFDFTTESYAIRDGVSIWLKGTAIDNLNLSGLAGTPTIIIEPWGFSQIKFSGTFTPDSDSTYFSMYRQKASGLPRKH